jgi:hypothetical protein
MTSATRDTTARDRPAADAVARLHDARRQSVHRGLCADGAVGLSLHRARAARYDGMAGGCAVGALRPASSEAQR